ncbi:sulfite exporter TauE/SafE family protein [Sphingobacterium sp. HJSM2_6]|uniref:sulfite exporter TauE/SafE family protein n=1 Tax=Sphingobacterium sp. HJSM2_6 TaxID=3366264 RepID=UPI003BC6350F
MLTNSFELLQTPYAWALYFFCAMLIGVSKTGIQNIGTFTIPFFAFLFGAKESTGIVLILLCLADLLAIIYYRKEFLWSEVKGMMPYAILGLLIGLFIGDWINDQTFKIIMGVCILSSVLLMIWGQQKSKNELTGNDYTKKKWYSPVFGLLVGFSTMIGNAAGPALTIFLLTKKLNKVTLVATGAWFIMILNFSKIPLQAFVWKNLSWEGIILNIIAIPFILLGGYIGIKLVKIIPEKEFRIVILALVLLSAIMLIVG